MKQTYLKKVVIGTLLVIALGTTAVFAATGTIDPAGAGKYKAAFLDSSVVADTAINFGKFTTQSQYNITVTDTELFGYAWGSSVGYIVTNCFNTTSGCSATNGNFKIANNAGVLSGYAWGENTGWINFGPFTDPSISTVKIASNGNFGGTLGSAGYAWSQNYGWIVFDCISANTCVNTDWGVVVTPPTPGGGTGGGGGGTSGGGGVPGGTTAPTTPTTPTTPTEPTTPTTPTTPTKPSTPSTPTTPTQPTDNTPVFQPPGNVFPDPTGPNDSPVDAPITPTDNPAESTNEPGPFDNGLQLPPAFIEAMNTIINSVRGILGQISSSFVPAGIAITDALNTPTGKSASAIATAIGAGATIIGALALAILSNPLGVVDLVLLPLRLWNLFLVIFGLKKRNHPWGTVYDSVTKQPIDPAYVMLTDMNGNEVATSLTDIDGRYGFSVPPGTYRIVANKTNFEFPSKKLAGQSFDELYPDLYFGDVIVIKEEGEVITKNIPMDQLNFDWNEFAKTEQHRLSYYKRTDLIVARVSSFFFGVGITVAAVSLIAAQTTYNSIVFIVYLILFLIRLYSPQFKAKGSVTDAMTGEPLPFAILRINSVATGQEVTHKVADRLGNYYGLVPNGTYSISIDKKNPDASYTKTLVPTTVTVTNGFLQESFRV